LTFWPQKSVRTPCAPKKHAAKWKNDQFLDPKKPIFCKKCHFWGQKMPF
jgi:hypothetical protein